MMNTEKVFQNDILRPTYLSIFLLPKIFRLSGSTYVLFHQKYLSLYHSLPFTAYILYPLQSHIAHAKLKLFFGTKFGALALADMEGDVVRRRINMLAAHFAPNDEIASTHVLPMVIPRFFLLILRLVFEIMQ